MKHLRRQHGEKHEHPQIALGIRFSSAARRLASKSMVSLND